MAFFFTECGNTFQKGRLFNISHSTISHNKKICKEKKINNKKVKNQFYKINSQIEI